jgi:antitoxin component HigA of HigAB toxin-antitoxin module
VYDLDPIEALLYHMESRGLTRRDLEPYLGSRARVWRGTRYRMSVNAYAIPRMLRLEAIPKEPQQFEATLAVLRETAGTSKYSRVAKRLL